MKVTLALPPLEAYEPGADLALQGEAASWVYYVAKGLVKFTHADPDGHESILELAFGGELVGAQSALLGEECLETVTTVARSRLARWRASEFTARFGHDPAFACEVSRLLCRRICQLRGLVFELARLTAEQRFDALLRRWAESEAAGDGNSPCECDLPLTRDELASVLSISRCHLSRILTGMEERGLIKRGARLIPVVSAVQRKPGVLSVSAAICR
jgi:CRP/FNR family transcriptional regulator